MRREVEDNKIQNETWRYEKHNIRNKNSLYINVVLNWKYI